MKKIYLQFLFGSLLFIICGSSFGQTTLVTWDFPNNPDDAIADGGITVNLTKTISAQKSAGNTPTVNFAGAGATTRTAIASGWDGGNGTKWWEISFSTTGYKTIKVSSKQRSSGSGPKDWKIQYKIGAAGTWTDFAGNAVPAVADNFTSGVVTNLTLPAVTENVSDVYLRWIMTSNLQVSSGSVAAAGTSRIDDIIITGVVGDPSVNLSVDQTSGSEAATTQLTFTATASAAVTGAKTLDFALTSGSAVTGDFTSIPATITIANGATTGTAVFNVVDDAIYECTESGTFSISIPAATTGIVLGTTTSQAVSITDNDLPAVNLSINTGSGSEASSTSVTLTATSAVAVKGNQVLTLSIAGTATAADFSGLPATITILDGATTGTATFTVFDDAVYEGTENATFSITLPSSPCVVLGTTVSQGFSITDNEMPTVSISVSPTSGTEVASTSAVIKVTSVAPVAGDQTITVSLSGTASAADLSGASFPATVTILNGQTEATLSIAVVNDAVINEGTETATFTLSAQSAGISIGTPNSADFSIIDDDIVPAVAINSINDVAAANINVGSTGNIIYHFSTDVTIAGTTLNTVTLPVTYTSAADFQATGFKLLFNATTNSVTGAAVLGSVNPVGATLSFTGLTQAIASGTTGYFFVTADVAASATIGNVITATALPAANIIFAGTVTKTVTTADAGTQTIVAVPYVLFDNFDRPNNVAVGVPSSGGAVSWTEVESGTTSCASITNASILTLTRAGGPTDGREYVWFDMSAKYSTIFANSTSSMSWYFNIQQSRADPSGFGDGNYGAAYIIGSTSNDITTGNGYAIIVGNQSSPDYISLIRFTNGLDLNTNITYLKQWSPGTLTNEFSIRVDFNPCSSTWELFARNDGGFSLPFSNPLDLNATHSRGTVVDNTYTGADLKYAIPYWNRASGSGEQLRFDNLYIPSNISVATTYNWVGTTNNYQLATNWSPSRTCPKITDILKFDATGINTAITNIPDQTIGQILIEGTKVYSFKPVSGSSNTLTVAGASGIDFKVDAVSTLNLDVTSSATAEAMRINLLTGATGEISGNFNFINSVSSQSRSHRLMAADANAIVVKNGGIIKALQLTGEPFDNTGTANVVIFETGSVFEFYDGANPFGLTQPQSKIVFNTGSIYRHKVATTDPSLMGRTYGDFEFDISSGTLEFDFGSATASCSIDHLKVLSGTFYISSSSNNLPVNINIRKDLLVSSGAAFSYSPVATAAASTMSFSGSLNAQRINNAGLLTFGQNLTVKLDNSFATAPQLSVETPVKIDGTLDLTKGTIRLLADITISSNINHTARIGIIQDDAAISYGTGRFIIERFINSGGTHGKSWQFLSTPAKGETVFNTWQESGSPDPGKGAWITSPTGSGFDGPSQNPSLKYYNNSIADWTGKASTTDLVNGLLEEPRGYMIFVRGDRTVKTAADAPTPTVLRSKGIIYAPGAEAPGSLTSSLAGQLISIGNPYASAIGLAKVYGASANIEENFYLWDPSLPGSYQLGGYQTLAGAALYEITPGGTPIYTQTNYPDIQSGQAFFGRSSETDAGTVNLPESIKEGGSILVNRGGPIPEASQLKMISTLLYTKEGQVADGNRVVFDTRYNDAVDGSDAKKVINAGENFGLLRHNKKLVVEARGLLTASDTLFYNMSNLKPMAYKLVFAMRQVPQAPLLKAELVDKFLNNRTSISLTDSSVVNFDVTADAASKAADRFMLVFRTIAGPLPVTITSITAHRNADKTIAVNWKVENELNIEKYVVERSADGINFTGILNTAAANLNAYTQNDGSPLVADNYYRIKAISTGGTVQYSAVVKVNSISMLSSISVYPNPVVNKTIRLQFVNQPKGNYGLVLTNKLGQVIYKGTTVVNGNGFIKEIVLTKPAVAGTYQLQVSGQGGEVKSLQVIVE